MSDSNKDNESISKRTLVLGGLALAGIAAGIVYLSFSGKKGSAEQVVQTSKSKKTKGKSKKKKSKKSSKTSNAKSSTKSATSTGATESLQVAAESSQKKSKANSTAAVVEDIANPDIDESSLQTSGPISDDVFLSFLKQSNDMLKRQEIKDQSAAVYKRGESVNHFLKQKQAKVWKKLGIDPKYGIEQISQFFRSGTMKFQESFRASLQTENDLFTYAYFGNQQDVDKWNERLKRLMAEGNQELQSQAVALQNDRPKMQAMMEKLLRRFQEISQQQLANGRVQSPIEIVKMKAEMSDEDMKILIQGEQLMQRMAMEQQRAQMMRQMMQKQ